ncbi:MAG: hypothetical protein L6244_05240 [Candidatus Methanoperedenaceae archaeon]|nr:hypothetical protein [Candidatus Methanoperedenaceae archaeon]
MLEPYAVKVARTVLRRGGGSNLSFLFGSPGVRIKFVSVRCLHHTRISRWKISATLMYVIRGMALIVDAIAKVS